MVVLWGIVPSPSARTLYLIRQHQRKTVPSGEDYNRIIRLKQRFDNNAIRPATCAGYHFTHIRENRIISVWGEIYVPIKLVKSLRLFYWGARTKPDKSCIYVLELPLYTIFRKDFGTVQTVFCFLHFINLTRIFLHLSNL